MVSAVSQIAYQIDIPELWIRLVALEIRPDLIQRGGIGGEITDRLRVDIPGVHQLHPGGALILRIHQPGLLKLPLESAGPVHHVRRAHLRVEPGRVAAGEIRSHVGHAPVRRRGERDGGRPLRQLKHRARIAGGRLHVGGSHVLLEVLVNIVRHQVARNHPEASAKHPVGTECPGDSDARLKIIQILRIQLSGLMHDSALQSADRIRRRRVELRLLSVFGGKRRLVRPSKPQVQNHIFKRTEIVLHIQGMAPPARKPRRLIARELRARDRAEQETRERIPGVRRKRQFRSAHVVSARRQSFHQRVIPCANKLITGFHGMSARDLSQILLQGEILRDVLKLSALAPVESGHDLRKSSVAHVRDSEFRRPALSVSGRIFRLMPPVVAGAELIDHGG